MTTDTLRARAEALLKIADGFDGEFRWVPSWEGDNGGPVVANRIDFADGIYFVPDGEDIDPNHPTDNGCALISEELDEHVARPLIAILNDAPDIIRTLLAALPEPAAGDVVAWAQYKGDRLIGVYPGALDPRTGHDPGPASMFVPLVPASQPSPAPVVLTVGAALADARVQDGSHVAEYRNGPWRQLGFDGVRLFSSGRWKATSDRMYVEAYALPCRLVPIADADRDPGERGPL